MITAVFQKRNKFHLCKVIETQESEGMKMTSFERQMFYWKGEADTAYRKMSLYPKGDPRRLPWESKYKNALATIQELAYDRKDK